MFRRQWIIGALVLAAVSASPAFAVEKSQNKATTDKVAKQKSELSARADKALQKLFKEVPDSKKLYDKSAGYAHFAVTKAGFFVSGSGGSGVALEKAGKKTTYMKMGSAGAGLTFGADKFDMIFLFETKERLEKFVAGGWDSAASAKATAGTNAAGAASDFFEGQKLYTVSDKGLMASADISGTKFWADEDLNKAPPQKVASTQKNTTVAQKSTTTTKK
jgi:lipid-binding SYLF domain-containing protein